MTRQFLVMLIALAIATAFMLVFVDKRPWSSVGLGAKAAAPKILGAGLALGALGILLPSGVLLMAHWLRPAPATLDSVGSGAFTLQLAVLFLPQSLAEEMLSRGYIFAAIREGAGNWWAIGITSVLFAALHLDNPGANAESFAAVLLAGIFLGLIVVVTGSLWAAWMAHFAWNFSMLGVLHAPVSGSRTAHARLYRDRQRSRVGDRRSVGAGGRSRRGGRHARRASRHFSSGRGAVAHGGTGSSPHG